MTHSTPHTSAAAAAAAEPFRRFISGFERLLDESPDEARIRREGGPLLEALLQTGEWLEPACAEADATHYRQYLLHLDPAGRFSVVSFVWGPRQSTPIHDHTVWGLVGVLRGAEIDQRYADGPGGLVPLGEPTRLSAGEIDFVSPDYGDIHRVSNDSDEVSIGVHVYGADIGRVSRHVYRPDGSQVEFVSSYANAERRR